MVIRRRSEIGIRMALGADRTRVLGLIMREAAMLLAIGLAVGTVLALAGVKAATSLLFGLKAHDPGTFILSVPSWRLSLWPPARCLPLFARHPRFAGLLLQGVHLLLRGIQRLLLAIDLVLLFAGILCEFRLVA
jgi:ABC-type antimicrobial peptide transport system permease subunit